jgi:hypothetical protein
VNRRHTTGDVLAIHEEDEDEVHSVAVQSLRRRLAKLALDAPRFGPDALQCARYARFQPGRAELDVLYVLPSSQRRGSAAAF